MVSGGWVVPALLKAKHASTAPIKGRKRKGETVNERLPLPFAGTYSWTLPV